MFQKLAAARENGKKRKELTLVGFLVGGQKEFPRLFAKLRMEWKPLKGAINFNILKSGWFEITFSNQADFQRIWLNRPYHVFSQLLLLKTWYPGFVPTIESISQLDLWVRLHYLPEEFANCDALETIIEGNLIGKFLKMDPTHNVEPWNMFTRFCINTDVEKTLGRGVLVPDEHFNQLKLTLWFDDFSPGCGACGKSAHTFKDCPSKNAPIPTLQLTIKKPSSKVKSGENHSHGPSGSEAWNQVGKNNRTIEMALQNTIPSNNFYLSEKGGVNIIYESEESDEGIQCYLQEDETNPKLISVAADLHPYNIMKDHQFKGACVFSEGSDATKVLFPDGSLEQKTKGVLTAGQGSSSAAVSHQISKEKMEQDLVGKMLRKVHPPDVSPGNLFITYVLNGAPHFC